VNPRPPEVSELCADRYLTLPGAILRYRDQGHGPAVLLVHGWTLDLEMWQPQVSALRETFRVVRFDRRGFGLSSGRPGLAHDIADIEALCGHLAIERVALVGMSQGARPVLGFASASPDKISCLILDGSPDCLRHRATTDDLPLEHYRHLVRKHGINAFRREWLTHPLARLITDDPRQRDLLAAMIGRYPANDLLESALEEDVAPGPENIELIHAPVLVITGEHDVPSRAAAADALVRRLPGAQRAVITAAGHLPNLDNPPHYNAVVRAFLERYCLEPS
jgi:3-oxoadipate enol-lactonase